MQLEAARAHAYASSLCNYGPHMYVLPFCFGFAPCFCVIAVVGAATKLSISHCGLLRRRFCFTY